MYIVNGAVLERWSSLSDEQIVAQVVSGQTALFELLMRRHHERLYRAARAILRNDCEAEDLVQQAYLKAYANLRLFDRRTHFATWLTGIAADELLARVAMARERTATADAFAVRQTGCDRVVAAVLRRIE
jgi:DNA-directed RNA polymerase specialized sigma24 family protein